MFYLISREYVGPNIDENVNFGTLEISTEPARTNMSNEERVNGWCGTSNDVSTTAHGAYSTIEGARNAMLGIFGATRDTDEIGDRFESDDESVVEVHKLGSLPSLSKTDTYDWIGEDIEKAVTTASTDEHIEALATELADDDEYNLDRSVIIAIATELRDELRYELIEDSE